MLINVNVMITNVHNLTARFLISPVFVTLQQMPFTELQKASIECRFTQKRVRDMIRTYSQMHRTDKNSQHNSIIWPF